MINLKAILAGTSLIIFFGLLFQLIFILAATTYTAAIRQHPEWQTIGVILSYFFGTMGYFIIMSFSGYITAYIAKKNIYLHMLLITLLSTGFSIISSVREDSITLSAILFVTAGILFTMIGGHVWIKHQSSENYSSNG